MDGYALASGDFTGTRDYETNINQRVQAGDIPSPHIPGTAARIFTGAPLPDGCDTVLAQEETRLVGNGDLALTGPLKAGRFVRVRGDDVHHGQVIIPTGQRLRSQDVGLAAATGVVELPVWRRLRVAVVATGNELVRIGTTLPPGKIFNSNSIAVSAFLNQLGCTTTDCGIIPDNLDKTIEQLREAAEHHDIVITTGGASVGDEDYVKQAVERVGSLSFWRVAIKPGKPFAFGRVGSAAFIGLPGNPVSTLITLWILVQPFLRRSQGEDPIRTAMARRVIADFDRHNDSVRTEYLRVQINERDGDWAATPHPNQSSGVLTSLTWAHGLACIDPHTQISHGDRIVFFPFEYF
jgi:molybdopterin molybdotransferase